MRVHQARIHNKCHSGSAQETGHVLIEPNAERIPVRCRDRKEVQEPTKGADLKKPCAKAPTGRWLTVLPRDAPLDGPRRAPEFGHAAGFPSLRRPTQSEMGELRGGGICSKRAPVRRSLGAGGRANYQVSREFSKILAREQENRGRGRIQKFRFPLVGCVGVSPPQRIRLIYSHHSAHAAAPSAATWYRAGRPTTTAAH